MHSLDADASMMGSIAEFSYLLEQGQALPALKTLAVESRFRHNVALGMPVKYQLFWEGIILCT